MKIKFCGFFIILAFLLALTTLAVSAPSACVTSSGKVGRWFGTPGNMKCAGPGDSCPAANGPGIVYGIIPDNMKCAGLGDPCPAANGPGKMFGTPNNMKCAGLGDSCPAANGPGKVFGTPDNMVCAGLGDTCPAANGPGVVSGSAGNMKCTGLGDGTGGGGKTGPGPTLNVPQGGYDSGIPRPGGGSRR